MRDPREDVEAGKYDLGLGDNSESKADSYVDELMGYKPSFDGCEEGLDDD